ncbi:MAG: DUF2459 domain-containing protein [Proteobacteria bacterium]|nr:DUF2459 domain-containing protein [Pseudomonadota bacterium]MDA0914257.1 DUF2459 domain-containing protein [Pseudomonadota bacterium]MDA1032860.1 DUF2459 domain-containing protein [Pseudomonadota bacterium]
MAAQTTLKRLLLCPLAVLAAFALVFLLTAWIGSSIARNGDWEQPAAGVQIMIETNGVHTAIVMPAVSAQKDWRADFPADDVLAPNRPYTHVSVSWGEREVFLNTPTWWDLSLPTVFGAASGGEGLLHVSHYIRPAPSPDHRQLTISHAEYARLIAIIEREILPASERTVYRGYSDYDVFYDAPGTYHLGNTCNQWVSNTLAAAGIKTGWWTPMAGGVMKWVPEYEGA